MMPAREHTANHTLAELLDGLVALPDAQERPVSGLALDSRRVHPGELFLACAGQRVHGAEYAATAVAAGAVAVAWEPAPGMEAASLAGLGVPAVAVPKLSRHLGEIADRFYDHPSEDLCVLGVTGTNGKTSCSHFLAHALNTPQQPCAVIGTLGYGRPEALVDTGHTTPDAVTLQAILAQMRDAGTQRVAMEVSSHGLEQGRVNGIHFDLALWTNLSREHLDYHGDMQAYAAAKRRLFAVPSLMHAVINADDSYGHALLAEIEGPLDVVRYGFGEAVSATRPGQLYVHGRELRLGRDGLAFDVDSSWGGGRLESRLLGRFNAANLLGVLAGLLVIGMPMEQALARLATVPTVPGRMERLAAPGRPLAVVDYAHTPDALEQVLGALREHTDGRLWCVFGCGGERDRGKRPEMGRVAERLADRVVVTDDNPRGEDPLRIVAEILAGMDAADAAHVEHDREQAITFALKQATGGDVVLVAGKGHEAYQQVGQRRLPFDDRAVVRHLLEGGTV